MLLDVKNLNIKLSERKILQNICFQLSSWEVFSILWHNGCWKTTLSKSIIGLVKSKWDIIFDGNNINDLKIHERANTWIAYIMQEIPEYTWITVYNYTKNILKDKFDKQKISQLFDLFWLDFEAYKERNFDQHLSWWEKKKIEIITNFMMDKKLYILDEVETSLDVTSRSLLKDLISKKAKNGTSFIIISHNEDLINIASNGILLCDWKIQENWNIQKLLKRYLSSCKTCKENDNCKHLKNK